MSKQRKKGWKRRRWTAEERKFLLDNYGKLPTSVIAKKLNRTEDTIRSNARNLGIKIKAFSPFTKEEVAFLAENYGKRPVCEIAAEMGRSDSSVEHKAMRLGITTVRVASRKYCIDCGKKLSSAAIYRNNVCRCVECNVEFRQDENHPNWKGGVSTLDSIVYVLLRPIWGKPIMKRDGFTCQICGQRNGDKNVHHLRKLASIRDEVLYDHPELSPVDPVDKKKLALLIVAEHKLEDGITVCKVCHKDIHSEKRGELLETPNVNGEDNQQPSLSNVVQLVDRKVQRLTGEDTTSDKPDTSAPHTLAEKV